MTYVTGYPRIGQKRELKFALEDFWRGKIDEAALQSVAKELRKRHWMDQEGVDYISSNDFSFYDLMIDTIVMLGAQPKEYRDLSGLAQYFAMARGDKNHKALPMTKWFNTNYHYFVPQIAPKQEFSLNLEKVLQEYQEAKALGIETKINLIGPLSFLKLARGSEGNDPMVHLPKVAKLYKEAVEILARNGVKAVQFDEPVLVVDPDSSLLEAIGIYEDFAIEGIEKFIVTYFEHANEAVDRLIATPIDGIGLDFIHGARNIESVAKIAKSGKKLIAGIVDGRNVWVGDIDKKVAFLNALPIDKERVIVSTSCSLLHLPYTLEFEEKMDSQIKKWLAFAKEKLAELRLVDKLYLGEPLSDEEARQLEDNRQANRSRASSSTIHDSVVQERLKNLRKIERDMPALERLALQHERFGYPLLPTTTIGSFPQTPHLRKLRRDFKEGIVSEEEYKIKIKEMIKEAIALQERIDLDVLVHGEFERNDMVEYFSAFLQGVVATENGWVQSYGSRCVKPPLIFGDVARTTSMSVEWITYAQSLTTKPVKGMLTGPVTMLNWSFVRDDLPREIVYKQMALAIADEVEELQENGIGMIQVDEAAFKEGYPLRKEKRGEYERVAVESFKIATAVAKPQTQIHTHMCYSDFNDIMPTIDAMDADVISIETARNGNRILEAFKRYRYQKEVGVGVYDIHSPRIPSKEEIVKEIEDRLNVLPARQLWINPDCGLKTRKWDEVVPALTNMVEATKDVRRRIVKL